MGAARRRGWMRSLGVPLIVAITWLQLWPVRAAGATTVPHAEPDPLGLPFSVCLFVRNPHRLGQPGGRADHDDLGSGVGHERQRRLLGSDGRGSHCGADRARLRRDADRAQKVRCLVTLVTPTVTTTLVARNPLLRPLPVLAIVIVALAGIFIYGVIRKGL